MQKLMLQLQNVYKSNKCCSVIFRPNKETKQIIVKINLTNLLYSSIDATTTTTILAVI